jgi:beta-mannosidase
MRVHTWICTLCVFVVTMVSISQAEVAHLDLGGTWRLSQDDSQTTIAATVPGCVHLDLLAAGKIADPFYRDNQKTLQWISDASWSYSRSISIPVEFTSHRYILLRCEGLDTVAEISINDLPLATTDNMFRTYEFDAKPLLKSGDNTIKVTFRPIAPYIKKFISEATGPMSSVKGVANVRKAPYSNGWDFGPKFLTAGIYRKIELVGFDQGRLTHPAVTTHLDSDTKATVIVDASTQHARAPLTIRATLSFHGSVLATEAVSAIVDPSHFEIPVPNPHLWWPAGMGAQPLYDLELTLKDPQGLVVDHQKLRVGIRKIELLPRTDTQPLRLSVNGREIFAKGADWIPCDMFAPRVTAEQLHHYIADAAAVNMNMLRCWGGGYYEEDSFYDACDELGIMVWSEFKFACAVYPSGNPKFVDNVRAEVTDQANRLRNHPCMAVWCGNNEVMSLITGYKVLKQADYDSFFHGVIGKQIHELIPDSNYVGGSPEEGDEHNWWVWHVGANFEKYLDSHGWMTEFGFQSFPCPATVNSFTEPADRTSVLSPVMKAHQHNGNGRGNEMIVEMMGRYFQPAKDFDSTLWLSQINQAYGITMGIEHWRADWPRSSGALVWQYDDCWPGPTWSSVDYYGRWKALHYKLREAFAPLMVTAQYDSSAGQVQVHVCSDLATACATNLRWRLTDIEGKLAKEGSCPVAVPAGTCSVECPAISLADSIAAIGRKSALLWIELENDGHVVSRKTLWFIRPKSLSLVDPRITSSVVTAGGGYDITLNAAHPALWAWLEIESDPDARFSDNFIHLVPGRPVTVHVALSAQMSLAQLTGRLKIRSLFDTYVPETSDHSVQSSVDGSIIATAEKAEIIGTSAKLEAGNPPNIGGWSDRGDELDWSLNLTHPGTYHVLIDLACPAGVEGSEIAVTAGGQQASGVVPVTGGWFKFKVVDLGTLNVEEAGPTSLSLRAIKMPHGNVMNLRSITLKPA